MGLNAASPTTLVAVDCRAHGLSLCPQVLHSAEMADAWGKKAPAPKLSCRFVTIPHPTLACASFSTPLPPPTRPILCRDFQRAAWCMHGERTHP